MRSSRGTDTPSSTRAGRSRRGPGAGRNDPGGYGYRRSQPSVSYDIEYVGKVKSALFGGEGLFFATLRGPGRIWLQSLPFSRLANRIYSATSRMGGGKGEGGLLGTLLGGGMTGETGEGGRVQPSPQLSAFSKAEYEIP